MEVIALDMPALGEIESVNVNRGEYRYFCIPCLVWHGKLRHTTSPSFMCRKCSKIVGPHLTTRVKRVTSTVNGNRAKGLRTEARILALLTVEDEMDTTSIARALEMTSDGVRYGLRRLLAAGKIERRVASNRHYWKAKK